MTLHSRHPLPGPRSTPTDTRGGWRGQQFSRNLKGENLLINHIRNSLVTFVIISLLASNILTLFHQPFIVALSTAIGATFGIATLTSLMEAALDAKDIELSKKKKTIAKKNSQIQRHQKQMVWTPPSLSRHLGAIVVV
jgi:hypothetical protein